MLKQESQRVKKSAQGLLLSGPWNLDLGTEVGRDGDPGLGVQDAEEEGGQHGRSGKSLLTTGGNRSFQIHDCLCEQMPAYLSGQDSGNPGI